MTNPSKEDVLLDRFFQAPVPDEVRMRLEERFAEFELRLRRTHPQPTRGRIFSRRRFHYAAAASAALAAGTVAFWQWTAPPAWAEVAGKMESRPWLHMIGIHPKGAKLQFWISEQKGIYAMKAGETEFASFSSRTEDASWSWRTGDSVVRKSPFQKPPGELGHLSVLLSAFATGESELKLPGDDKILDQSRRTVELNGKKSWQYTFTLKAMDQGHANTYVVVFEVDPDTGLPNRWTRRSIDGGKELRFEIDYPKTGPTSIYDLGAPQNAKAE